ATFAERRPSCDFQKRCRKFLSSLELRDAFFDQNYDMCYCNECHEARGDKDYYTRGEPPKAYGIPVGWCRFGLKEEPRASALDVFDKWHVAFHGTRLDSVNAILECADLLFPGDIALGGRKLSEEEGHFNEDRKPPGFDTKQIFVSPSVRYAGDDIYAQPSSFEDPSTKKTFAAKTVLQLRINPNSYKVGPETIDATEQIDREFSNEELEWSTRERRAIILYGLLVKLEECEEFEY
ncbi:neuralized-like protein 4, partial [Oculina patagonica]